MWGQILPLRLSGGHSGLRGCQKGPYQQYVHGYLVIEVTGVRLDLRGCLEAGEALEAKKSLPAISQNICRRSIRSGPCFKFLMLKSLDGTTSNTLYKLSWIIIRENKYIFSVRVRVEDGTSDLLSVSSSPMPEALVLYVGRQSLGWGRFQ